MTTMGDAERSSECRDLVTQRRALYDYLRRVAPKRKPGLTLLETVRGVMEDMAEECMCCNGVAGVNSEDVPINARISEAKEKEGSRWFSILK